MKKLGFSLLVAICGSLLFVGCDQHRLEPETVRTSDITFTFSDGKDAGATKATVAAAETSVSEWCLYIVNSKGDVFDAVSTSSQSVTRSLPDGSYTAYAAVNCGLSAGSFNTDDEINAYQCSLADETSTFSMFGSKSFTVSNGATCTIPVYRLVAKVVINKVTVDFSSHPDYAAKTFTLDKVYLINVPGTSTLANGTIFVPTTWYNKREYSSSGVNSLVYDNVNVTLSSGSSHSIPHIFYTYQNNRTTDSHSTTWSARYTRLVLECSLGGVKTYYPINIVGTDSRLARNSLYTISEVIITDYGSDGPDLPIEGGTSFYFSAVATNWDGTHTIDETF